MAVSNKERQTRFRQEMADKGYAQVYGIWCPADPELRDSIRAKARKMIKKYTEAKTKSKSKSKSKRSKK